MEKINSEKALLYKEIEPLTDKINGPILVREINTKKFFVRKCYPLYLEEHLVTLKKIKHAHLPQIQDLIVQDGKLWLYEEFIHGRTLSEVIQTSEILETEQILTIAMSVLEALGALHNKGLVHRDIKPGNIMLTNDGVVKLIDFDAVRVFDGEKESDTVQLGTVGFASPEQFGFAESDERSDLYSLGVVMNICSVKEYPKKQLTEDRTLRAVIRKATKLEPAERYQSALEMHLALREQRSKQINAKKQAKSRTVASKNSPIRMYTNTRPITTIWVTNKYMRQLAITGSHWKERIASFFRKYIPGFRTETLWKRAIALSWYILLLIGTIGNVWDEPTGSLKILKFIDYLFMFWLPLVLFTNFLDYQRKLPLFYSENKIYRFIGYGLLFLFWFLITKVGLELNSFIYRSFN
ncbi:serine/threonine protein kinase [Candidatus Enterococcus ikei]|uniref:non-specific serine/threonine protein kinase n=1 Tax=Candidatus Enterococcus ikei TaxID=2815326 RepID=A0ABS3GZE6_9ENTE|nr:serine/threonine-protein kinase [Enterococcus sp. DIV0869a]MBO0440627.1 serine/threonine protein kinase [Enterococcus sp. DIV0869a]